MGIGAAQQALTVQVGLGLGLDRVDAELARRGGAQVAVQAGLVGDLAAQLAPLELAEGIGALEQLLLVSPTSVTTIRGTPN